MIAVVTVLLAFPAGYLIRSWTAANLAYAVGYLWAFVYQTLYLSLDDQHSAFTSGEFPWEYGVVAAGIFAAGFGLVALGHRVAGRRAVRPSPRTVSLGIPPAAPPR